MRRSHQCDDRPDAKAIARFMTKVDTAGPVPEDVTLGRCWEWTAHRCRKGYGQFYWRGRAWWAHQISYLMFNGPLTAGKHRAHLCNNAACVNPDHIEEQPPDVNVAECNRRRAAMAATADDIPF